MAKQRSGQLETCRFRGDTIEQAFAAAEQDRHQLQVDFIDQAGAQRLAGDIGGWSTPTPGPAT